MEGFGVHTFRLVDRDGGTSLVKFHWKPVAGVHSLVWEEAQLAAGTDPDFHRRDMADGIENGAFLEYELGIQVFPDSEDETFEGIDLLDPTKIVPEELAAVQLIGKLTLDRNPTNYFAETEQVAFHTGNLVPGVEVTNDPLMQARLFSYLDTQLTRLGGPNFTQLPINCPHAAVNDNLRDGMHQTAIHTGLAPYLPNSIDGGAPQVAPESDGGYVQTPRMISGPAVRQNPVSFDDHFSQARMFWLSMTDIERIHIVEAYTFELGKVFEQAIKERTLGVLAQVDGGLCELVAAGLGLPAPSGQPAADVRPSPALSQIVTEPGPVAGRVVGVLAGPGADLSGVHKLETALRGEGVAVRIISSAGGELGTGVDRQIVDRTLLTTRSIEYDAIVVADGLAGLVDVKLTVLLQEAFRHCKPIGGWGDAGRVLQDAGVDISAPGILLGDKVGKDTSTALIAALGLHRVWNRAGQVMGAVPRS